MAYERKWLLTGVRPLLSDGGEDGSVTIESTSGFKVKQIVKITAIGVSPVVLQVKRVLSPTKMLVGPKDSGIQSRYDLSEFTVAKSSTISATEQDKKVPTDKEIHSWVYEQEPTVAYRTIGVDEWGRFYTTENPFPVQLSDGSVNIGTVNAELEVQLSHKDNYPDAGDVADSVQIGDGEDILGINPDGSINIVIGELPGTPIIYKEAGSFTNTTETKVAEYISNDDENRIKRLHGMAMTFGVWRVYKNTIDADDLLAVTQTSPTVRNADLLFSASELVANGDKVIITFQAERYRSNLLGSSSDTFVRLEGYNKT